MAGGSLYVAYLALTSHRDWPNHYPVANVAYVAGLATPILIICFCIGWFGFRKRKDPS
jgi:cytochrome c biogenesis protein CcdA